MLGWGWKLYVLGFMAGSEMVGVPSFKTELMRLLA